MNWQYRTIIFEFAKDGLLGERYVNDEDMEQTLNDQGSMGWELVSVVMVQEGLLAVLKRPGNAVASKPRPTAALEEGPGSIKNRVPESMSKEAVTQQEQEHIRSITRAEKQTGGQPEKRHVGDIPIS